MIVTIEARLDYKIEGPATVLLQIEAAEAPDQRMLAASTDITAPKHVVRVPAEDGIGERSWVLLPDRLHCVYSARVEVDRPAVDLRALAATPLHALPAEAVKHLMGSRFIPSERFDRFVDAEFPRVQGGARIAAMRDWIETNFEYVRGSSDGETTALDSFVERQGVCRDYAHVMIAFARAARIPARMVSVYAPSVEPPDFHAVAEVFLDGAWRLVDATGMATADEIVRIGVGRDAADIAFMLVYGPSELVEQRVTVMRG